MPKARRTNEDEKQPLKLLVPREEAHRRIGERLAKGAALPVFQTGFEYMTDATELEASKKAYKIWQAFNTEMLKQMFSNSDLANEYSHWFGGLVGVGRPSLAEEAMEHRESVSEKLHRLESIRERLELIPEAPGVAPASGTSHVGTVVAATSNRVFVVHGHDDAVRETVARFLERLGLEAVILNEMVSGGRTVVEKLEHYGDVHFAVVLLTPDDIGASSADPGRTQPRARQNVVMELGYFIGRLGRARVCALHKGSVELPSDILGVVWVSLDSAKGWQLVLAKELKNAGFPIDMNDVA